MTKCGGSQGREQESLEGGRERGKRMFQSGLKEQIESLNIQK